LRDFQPEIFVDALLGNNEDTAKILEKRAKKMLNIVSESDTEITLTKKSGLSDLKATFDSNNVDDDDDAIDDSSKPKRKARPKPQKLVQKKKK
jgi:hypothetical protein